MGIEAVEKIKFGCHNFLNSQPILLPLIEKKINGLEIVQDSPANLARMLREGMLSLSFVPSIEYARNSGYRLVNNISISSFGTVDTVLLISKKKMSDIKTVAADNRSLSSIVLLKILFMEKYNRLPAFSYKEPDCKKMLSSSDGALVIGDLSFLAAQDKETTKIDLSHEWFKITGKPFVHAVLCVGSGIQVEENIIKQILNSRDSGLSTIEQIGTKAAQKAGITPEKSIDYLKNKIIYTLGLKEQEGLKEFFSLAYKHGFIKARPELRFVC